MNRQLLNHLASLLGLRTVMALLVLSGVYWLQIAAGTIVVASFLALAFALVMLVSARKLLDHGQLAAVRDQIRTNLPWARIGVTLDVGLVLLFLAYEMPIIACIYLLAVIMGIGMRFRMSMKVERT